MNILSLDLGQTTGYVIGDEKGTLYETGYKNFASVKKNENQKKVYYDYYNWVEEQISKNNINLIVYEKVMAHKGTLASHAYGYYEGVLFCLCGAKRSLLLTGLNVTTIKKHVCGIGTASKQEVQDKITEKYHTKIKDYNESDALAIFDCYITRLKDKVEHIKREVQKNKLKYL